MPRQSNGVLDASKHTNISRLAVAQVGGKCRWGSGGRVLVVSIQAHTGTLNRSTFIVQQATCTQNEAVITAIKYIFMSTSYM